MALTAEKLRAETEKLHAESRAIQRRARFIEITFIVGAIAAIVAAFRTFG